MTETSWRLDLEYVKLVEDLMASEAVQKLQTITQHHFSTRLEHSISVSYTSYKIAKKLNLDCSAIARAGLLHDFFHEDREMFKQHYAGCSHAAMHPQIALKNAKEITALSELECDIIEKHMWLAAPGCMKLPRYKESYVVTMVDKYCATKEAVIPLPGMISSKAKHKAKQIWTRLKPLTV
ncbi:HD domain-containing protein [Pisciglobus halotolerans]|uniref:HD/PDEase domain-containing protein n=1 Tax=Pisciglobus halotolerans TaxID=745365 RepID=A0A1I3CKV9_9LACT|nr:HD domain-containing protein [Pisciglobus halotolerans]SFH74889.1 uncharacterized protein SAMN04489868_11926 [Pisciglobus halotolerans]